MIPQDKNFKKDFSAVLKDLDSVLAKHKDKQSATVSLAMSSVLTRYLFKTAPNDFAVINILLEPYLTTRNQQVEDAKKVNKKRFSNYTDVNI
jgi:ketopantoate hydroxymethyltransferase